MSAILPGFFIEYLVIGSCALLWIFRLFRLLDPSTDVNIDLPLIALLTPVLYVIGMLVDFCSRLPLMTLREYLKRKGFGAKVDYRFDSALTALWVRSPELAKQADIRSSRDRIARGTTGNFFVATIVFTVAAFQLQWAIPWWSMLTAGVTLTTIAVLMWLRFDRLTSQFISKALKALREAEPEKEAWPGDAADP